MSFNDFEDQFPHVKKRVSALVPDPTCFEGVKLVSCARDFDRLQQVLGIPRYVAKIGPIRQCSLPELSDRLLADGVPVPHYLSRVRDALVTREEAAIKTAATELADPQTTLFVFYAASDHIESQRPDRRDVQRYFLLARELARHALTVSTGVDQRLPRNGLCEVVSYFAVHGTLNSADLLMPCKPVGSLAGVLDEIALTGRQIVHAEIKLLSARNSIPLGDAVRLMFTLPHYAELDNKVYAHLRERLKAA